MKDLINALLGYVTVGMIIIAVLAFVTSVITQITKTWGFLNRIPTDIQVYVVSLILTMLCVFTYIQYAQLIILWYYIIGGIILSFFVTFVALRGWKQLTDLWGRFNPKEINNNTEVQNNEQ